MKKKMKKIIFSLFILISINLFSQTPCTNTLFPPCNTAWQNTDLWQIDRDLQNSTGIVSGNVGGFSTKRTLTIAVDGTYTAGSDMSIGGVLTFSNLFRVGQNSGVLLDVEIFDPSKKNPDVVIDFWAATPTGTITDHVATVLTSNTTHIGSVNIVSSDYSGVGGVSRANIKGIGMVLYGGTYSGSVLTTSRTIYATIIINGSTAAYVASSLYFKIGVLQD